MFKNGSAKNSRTQKLKTSHFTAPRSKNPSIRMTIKTKNSANPTKKSQNPTCGSSNPTIRPYVIFFVLFFHQCHLCQNAVLARPSRDLAIYRNSLSPLVSDKANPRIHK